MGDDNTALCGGHILLPLHSWVPFTFPCLLLAWMPDGHVPEALLPPRRIQNSQGRTPPALGMAGSRALSLESRVGILNNASSPSGNAGSSLRLGFTICKVGAELGSMRVEPAQGLSGFLGEFLC